MYSQLCCFAGQGVYDGGCKIVNYILVVFLLNTQLLGNQADSCCTMAGQDTFSTSICVRCAKQWSTGIKL